jgi:hypothetical protein
MGVAAGQLVAEALPRLFELLQRRRGRGKRAWQLAYELLELEAHGQVDVRLATVSAHFGTRLLRVRR